MPRGVHRWTTQLHTRRCWTFCTGEGIQACAEAAAQPRPNPRLHGIDAPASKFIHNDEARRRHGVHDVCDLPHFLQECADVFSHVVRTPNLRPGCATVQLQSLGRAAATVAARRRAARTRANILSTRRTRAVVAGTYHPMCAKITMMAVCFSSVDLPEQLGPVMMAKLWLPENVTSFGMKRRDGNAASTIGSAKKSFTKHAT